MFDALDDGACSESGASPTGRLFGFFCKANPNSGCIFEGIESPLRLPLYDPAFVSTPFLSWFCRHKCASVWLSADRTPCSCYEERSVLAIEPD